MKQMILDRGKHIWLQVDGGIYQESGKAVVEAGANVLVAGSYIFGSEDLQLTIKQMKELT